MMTRDQALGQARQLVAGGQATPAAIARAIGRNRVDIANVLRGARACSVTLARQIAEAARQVSSEEGVKRALGPEMMVKALGILAARECGIDPASRQVAPLGYYLAVTAGDVKQADLARAMGCSRQNIHKALPAIEDIRENPVIDAALERITGMIGRVG